MTSQSHMNQGPEDEREQEARKIVQICAIPASEGRVPTLFALDSDGRVSIIPIKNRAVWENLPPLPES